MQGPVWTAIEDEGLIVGSGKETLPQGVPAAVRGLQKAQRAVSTRERALDRKEGRRLATHGDPAERGCAEEVLVMAARMPARMRCGLGGQPGTATLTGMTLETRPQLA